MIRTWQAVLMLGVVGILVLLYQGLWGDPRHIPSVLVGKPAPLFSGPEVMTGEQVSVDQYRGKVVMLNFWASWCQECFLEHENLLAIHRRFSDHPDFVMLGINYQDKESDARKYLETYGSSFQHVRDEKGVISIDYGVYGVPETFVFDRQGIIRFKYVGPIMGQVFTHLTEEVIEPLLEGRSVES